uniref:Signal recognition particle receptor subunit alpha n=1 Tax=Hadrurus spadix TaxID=141984 RepID=A0A1W7R9L0_9SCOR
MLDLFTIFSKSGIVLWCFQGTSDFFRPSVNSLIRNVLLQERGGNNAFTHDGLTLKYKLDNEFELIFVVAYQKILQLSYIDKFLDDIHLEFRDKFKKELVECNLFSNFNFIDEYNNVLRIAEEHGRILATQPKKMRTYEQSQKSKKTIASMIENKDSKVSTKGRDNAKKKEDVNKNEVPSRNGVQEASDEKTLPKLLDVENPDHKILQNRQKIFDKRQPKGRKQEKLKNAKPTREKSKQPRIWELGGVGNVPLLDFSKKSNGEDESQGTSNANDFLSDESRSWIGKMKGEVQGMDYSSEEETEQIEEDDNSQKKLKKPKSGGVFSMFQSLVGSKSITAEDMKPVLEKLKDHMIAKNVAADIAVKLCESVSLKLQGKVLGTFSGITSTVKATLTESLVQLLSPKRRIDLLRDIMEAQNQHRPYSMVFCGVNGVGKSTNLAKIAFWLVENNFRVLIAACDTFRAGAVEQLRTHTHHLNALHPADHNNFAVQLYEKGYGKDAAGIAMEAINYANDVKIDVVLIDTAGRMQDNEPLMRALAKLIKVNSPDLVLFVGEALVGNEAVDQLVKFNRALADHSSQENPHLIDGIVLTKFDTIDDKVGAAISMTYITGQPIIFVGTGQTYTDLKTLNPKAVVHSLMK